MKKELNVDGIILNADGKSFTLGVSVYEKTNNLCLFLETDGVRSFELTVDVDDTLPFNQAVLKNVDEDWIKSLLLRNGIGNFCGNYYQNRKSHSMIFVGSLTLKDFAKDEYMEYKEYCEKHPKKRPTKKRQKKKERIAHWDALEDKRWRPKAKISKGKYKSSDDVREANKRYREKNDAITAYLPKGMKAEIEQYGEKATVVLKRCLLNYLEEQGV